MSNWTLVVWIQAQNSVTTTTTTAGTWWPAQSADKKSTLKAAVGQVVVAVGRSTSRRRRPGVVLGRDQRDHAPDVSQPQNFSYLIWRYKDADVQGSGHILRTFYPTGQFTPPFLHDVGHMVQLCYSILTKVFNISSAIIIVTRVIRCTWNQL